MKRPTELIEKAKGFKSTDPIRVLAEYAVSLESPRKTVKDAVDFFDGVWPFKDKSADVVLFFSESNQSWHVWLRSYAETVNHGYVVCTREEFEAEVERRKGGEWTYVDVDGLKLKLLVDNPDEAGEIPAICEDGYYRMYDFEDLELIKPTISKVEVDAVKAFFRWAEKRPCAVLRVEDYLEQFDVV